VTSVVGLDKTMTGISSFTVEKTPVLVCKGCGNEFTPTDHRQTVCRKNCGRIRKAKRVQFVGVDGEGVNGNHHRYVLFGVGDRHISDPTGLTWQDCFDFLYGEFQRRGKGCAFVGFFLGYDFTQILKRLPEDRARLLFTIEGKAKRKHRVKGKEPHPVVAGRWEFDILGFKRLRIRPHDCDCKWPTCEHPKQSWCYLCDVGGFWQTSFLNVINPEGWEHPICTPEEYELIKAGKERRGGDQLTEDDVKYMHLEIDVLERAMGVLADGFESIGIHLTPRQWYGPGQASATWMRGKVPKRDEWIAAQPQWFLDAARCSYYGGWFEVFCHGRVPRAWEYDINSAYPAVIKDLPCLMHGEWLQGDGAPTGVSEYTLVKARVKVPGFTSSNKRKQKIGTMLHRSKDGGISRPAITEGWFWQTELEAAIRAKCVDRKTIEYHEWVTYAPCSCPPPFRDIEGLYTKRLEVGKDSPLGKSSKLVYNSGYGKFAQSIGDPQYGNPIYASKITSKTRERILDAIATHPKGQAAVAMVATDAVFFLEPHPNLPLSNRLGEWEEVVKNKLTIFKPGVYWDQKTRDLIREGKAPKFKARGINAKQFASEIARIDFWFSSWNDTMDFKWPEASFERGFNVVTCLQALMRNKWELAGNSDPSDEPMYHSSNPFRKRGELYKDDEWGVWRTEIIRQIYDWDLEDYANCISFPYEKRFGIEDPFSEENQQALGVTQDGMVADSMHALFDNDRM